MTESSETETVDFPTEPTVVRELDRLYCVGIQPKQADERSCDGRLIMVSPSDGSDEGVHGFTSSVIPGTSMLFHIEQNEAQDAPLETPPVETIELMSDGSYRITTEKKGYRTVYRLIGTHSRKGEVINDPAAAGPIEQKGQRTTQTLDGLLGHRRES